MSYKELKFNQENIEKLKKGVDELYKAVSVTLGPAGRNVIIEKEYESPISTKDGVTVAKEIKLKDKFENLGVSLVKEAASQTNDIVGDGTTTSTVLAHAIIKGGLSYLKNEANPIEIKRGIEKTVKEVVKLLKSHSKDISSQDEIKQVAMISSNNDEIIGQLISEAMNKVGREGVVTVEDSNTSESYLEVVEGMQFARGYLSPYFINKQELMQVQLENPYILLYDKRISTIKELVKLMEQVIAKNRPLLIIAEDIEGEALSTLIVNKLRGSIQCCAVKAPEYGTKKTQLLEDLAILTGGKVISPEKGDKLDKVTVSELGECRLVTIDNKNTTIIDGKGDVDKIKERIVEIKSSVEKSTSNYETEKLQERLGKLAGGVAVIYIGAETEVEMKEKHDRVDDSLHATKAAIDEGIIPGGGIALYYISTELDKKNIKLDNKDQEFGYEIVMNAIKQPFTKIVMNAGLVPDVIWNEIRRGKSSNFNSGYDVRNECYIKDMYEEGIVDPTKVSRVALEKAASVAGLFLTTECSIVINNDDEKHNCQHNNEE